MYRFYFIQVSALSFPRFVQLLQFTCYSKTVLSGLVISIGGLQDSLRKTATSSLLGYVQAFDSSRDTTNDGKEHGLSVDLRWILEQYQKCDRVIIPTLKVLALSLIKAFQVRKYGLFGRFIPLNVRAG